MVTINSWQVSIKRLGKRERRKVHIVFYPFDKHKSYISLRLVFRDSANIFVLVSEHDLNEDIAKRI